MEQKVKQHKSDKHNKSTDLRSGNVGPKGEMRNSPVNVDKEGQENQSATLEKKDSGTLVKKSPKKKSGSGSVKRKVSGSGSKKDSNSRV